MPLIVSLSSSLSSSSAEDDDDETIRRSHSADSHAERTRRYNTKFQGSVEGKIDEGDVSATFDHHSPASAKVEAIASFPVSNDVAAAAAAAAAAAVYWRPLNVEQPQLQHQNPDSNQGSSSGLTNSSYYDQQRQLQMWYYQQQVAAYYAQQRQAASSSYSPTSHEIQQQPYGTTQQQEQQSGYNHPHYTTTWTNEMTKQQLQQQQQYTMQQASYPQQRQKVATQPHQSRNGDRFTKRKNNQDTSPPSSTSPRLSQSKQPDPHALVNANAPDVYAALLQSTGSGPSYGTAVINQKTPTKFPPTFTASRPQTPPQRSPRHPQQQEPPDSLHYEPRRLSRSASSSPKNWREFAVPPPSSVLTNNYMPSSTRHHRRADSLVGAADKNNNNKSHRRSSSDGRILPQQQQQWSIHDKNNNNNNSKKPTGFIQQNNNNSRRASTGSRLPMDPWRARKKELESLTANHRGEGGGGWASFVLPPLPSPKPLTSGRSVSSGTTTGGMPFPQQQFPTHRRGSSQASGMSLMSEGSMVSYVSDIRQSVFYGGVSESTGKVQMRFPLGYVHLVPIETKKRNDSVLLQQGQTSSPSGGRDILNELSNDYPLQVGHLYKVANNEEEFEDYHFAAEDSTWSGEYEDFNTDFGVSGMSQRQQQPQRSSCRCHCPQCATCTHKATSALLLPPNYFLLAVEDSLYRRLLDEIYASQHMPCGLFFCGHHEDVSRPSLFIPVCLLGTLFSVMGLVAYHFRA